MRRLLVVTLLILSSLLVLTPAEGRRMPGAFTGFAFDSCHTPSQAAMDVWLERSPYWGIGVYISGSNRACANEPNLTRTWVRAQSRKGWRILALTVGRQASCWRPHEAGIEHIAKNPRNEYAAARKQGHNEAGKTVRASRALGIARGSTQWLDVEAFDITKRKCRQSALAFVQSWTKRLHGLGYKSGFYSSAASGIALLDRARRRGDRQLPDQVWIAEWNFAADTSSSYISDEGWRRHRVHQYRGGHDSTYGGVTLNIDSNWMDVGGGTRAPKGRPHCRVQVSYPSYAAVKRGDRAPRVKALQCLLKQQHVFKGKLTERFDRRTAKAVRKYQHRNPPLRVSGRATKSTWVALLSDGGSPLLKIGAGSDGVLRLQRALNAATKARLDVTGIYDRATAKAVKAYQKDRSLGRTGVTTDAVWKLLHRGRR